MEETKIKSVLFPETRKLELENSKTTQIKVKSRMTEAQVVDIFEKYIRYLYGKNVYVCGHLLDPVDVLKVTGLYQSVWDAWLKKKRKTRSVEMMRENGNLVFYKTEYK